MYLSKPKISNYLQSTLWYSSQFFVLGYSNASCNDFCSKAPKQFGKLLNFLSTRAKNQTSKLHGIRRTMPSENIKNLALSMINKKHTTFILVLFYSRCCGIIPIQKDFS